MTTEISNSAGKSEISQNQGGKHTPKIGVVGHSRAGKSTFLAVLKTAFEGAGWAATVRTTDKPSGPPQPSTSSLRDPAEYVKYLRRFIEAGFFPPGTRVQDTADRVSFDVTQGQNRFEIDCFDPAGEVLEGKYNERSPEAASLAAIHKSLKECKGVLLLLDPETHPDLWLRTWDRVEPGLNMEDPPRVAVCFAKADTGVRQRRFRVRDALSWVQSQPGGRSLLTQIQNRKLDTTWYFVSATGWLNGASNIRAYVDSRPIRRTGTEAKSGRPREFVPDPAQRVDGAIEGDDTRGYRYSQNLPIFTDPLRLRSQDFRHNPIFDAGPWEILRDELKNLLSVKIVEEWSKLSPDDQMRWKQEKLPKLNSQMLLELWESIPEKDRERWEMIPDSLRTRLLSAANANLVAGVHVGFGRGGSDSESRIRPWNVVEPVLWLAKLSKEAR